jgi:hypothetical protein
MTAHSSIGLVVTVALFLGLVSSQQLQFNHVLYEGQLLLGVSVPLRDYPKVNASCGKLTMHGLMLVEVSF